MRTLQFIVKSSTVILLLFVLLAFAVLGAGYIKHGHLPTYTGLTGAEVVRVTVRNAVVSQAELAQIEGTNLLGKAKRLLADAVSTAKGAGAAASDKAAAFYEKLSSEVTPHVDAYKARPSAEEIEAITRYLQRQPKAQTTSS